MTRLKAALPLLALAGLSACGGAGGAITPYHNPGLGSANQPVVQRSDYVIDLASTGTGGLAPQEAQRLSGWFQSLELGYGDRIFVDDGTYADPAVREDIARAAAAHGLLLSHGAPVTAGSPPPGSVRVVVSRATASVPDCPNWEGGEINSRSATTSPNFGCATNSNLAAMIADPNDLVLGRTATPGGDAAAAAKAVQAYRDRAPSGVDGQVKVEATGGSN